ncbi:Outer membrane usher protein fimD precursor [Serratia entomophila]|uniref:fimbria/pilus outer membrane usher protein n=1 Tax=Serratia entomophila TaxID=42906 RepID=UPI00217A272B|nr:fimbria/pilus outer membrane usher protein [Serratia entomophila]CAI1002185.1 Outer membrane usher protein fimD precursor [Serratia entomophila]CAI1076465.1 Outer membrane usher protein fimD precursor [Serratia entomophila]CAI1095804.1 Outer membrane usher protein fimD precursor [Serratia entomophila]CAI1558540.1 Outer membrane usher protein fimD precursor [Serratia entomophila]CAI1651833.1 Outer membrane usher protein fimD precursor [Serratia entomophila]
MNNPNCIVLRTRSFLAYLISCQAVLLLNPLSVAHARDYFNPALLEIDNPALRGADLSVFEDNDSQAPGSYRVDLYLNGQQVDSLDVEFRLQQDAAGKKSLQPCFSAEKLAALGVRVGAFPALGNGDSCVNLSQAIPQASATFLFSQLRLNLSIPQAALNLNARDYVSPDKWDSGVPALLVNYNFSGANSQVRENQGQDSNNYYLNLRSGVNWGAWRLRNYSVWNQYSGGASSWRSINTYLQRDVVALQSRLTLGDSTTSSDVFDSVQFRGGQLASEDELLPDSLKGYSPVVRGIARTNAQIVIRQNGYVIYQSYVPPGAFEITDLYPTGGSGDLNVSVREADGQEQNFVVPYAVVPVLQREGRFKYSLTSGKYRSYGGGVDERPFSQLTGIYGLPWGATLYGGVQAASKYQSLALGWGQNLGAMGALSADVTQAWTKTQTQPKEQGQSWRLRYGKNFIETGTNFSLASYRYSTRGFYTLQEALESYGGNRAIYNDHKKSRAELTLSQNLGAEGGSLSLSLFNEDYWNDNRRSQSASVSYNNSWQSVSYGLNYTFSQNGYDSNGNRVAVRDHIVAFNVSVPLGSLLPGGYATYGMNASRNGATSNNLGLSGTALEGNNLNYSISQGYTGRGVGANGNIQADYKGSLAELNLGYGYDRHRQQVNYGIQGGVLVHQNGITLSQPLGDTVALVQAPGAAGVNVLNQTGVSTDWRGYAVVPYLTPYRRNIVGLDGDSFAEDVDMTMSSQTVIPTRGAVVRANFNPNVGLRVLMTLLTRGGSPVPFGATVSAVGGASESAGIVGDGGQVYLAGMAESGQLQVKWGNGADRQCQVNYRLANQSESGGIRLVNEQCL